jgi:hypothetical protein
MQSTKGDIVQINVEQHNSIMKAQAAENLQNYWFTTNAIKTA